jgi:hypothetical protein
MRIRNRPTVTRNALADDIARGNPDVEALLEELAAQRPRDRQVITADAVPLVRQKPGDLTRYRVTKNDDPKPTAAVTP